MEMKDALIGKTWRPEEGREVLAKAGELWFPWPWASWASASDEDDDGTKKHWWVVRSNHQIRRRTIDLPEHDRAAHDDENSLHDPGKWAMGRSLLATTRLEHGTAEDASTDASCDGKMIDRNGNPLAEEAQARKALTCGASAALSKTWKGTRAKMKGTCS